jgi:hypothetical protein
MSQETTGFIEVTREPGGLDSNCYFELRLNAKRVGSLAPGDTQRLRVAPGINQLRVVVDTLVAPLGSREVKFSVSAGQTLQFSVKSRGLWWRFTHVSDYGSDNYVAITESKRTVLRTT